MNTVNRIEVLGLEYLDYSTGSYIVNRATNRRADGITLQFRCAGREYYTIFNADTHRKRNTAFGKIGDPLPKGHFIVGKKSDFVKFWISTGLPYQRLSNLHQRMGKLASLKYAASVIDGERLDSASLRPLVLSNMPQVTTINPQTPHNQGSNKTQTIITNSNMAETQKRPRFQPKFTTGEKFHGKTVLREHGYTVCNLSPDQQSVEEWLADYDSASEFVETGEQLRADIVQWIKKVSKIPNNG